MADTFAMKCRSCWAFGPLNLVGNQMLCQSCAARPTKDAYFGTVILFAALGFVGVMLLTGGLYVLVELYLGRQAQKRQEQPLPLKPIQQPGQTVNRGKYS